MRRLPIFLVLDVSESMVGQPLRTLQEGIKGLVAALRTDPHALETVHLSIIAFAGVAKTLTPLMELMMFYPPRLPIGAGTSLGKALHHVMDEMEQHVVRSSPERKGDWKPMVYLLSDGRCTDDPSSAITRWQRDFTRHATLISIGVGMQADLSRLQSISHHTLRLENTDVNSLKNMIAWLTQSITANSRSLGVEAPLSLEKSSFALSLVKDLNEAGAVDESAVILSALCRETGLPYVLKYERMAQGQSYQFTGAYALEADYQEWSDARLHGQTIAMSQLYGGGACPHCHAQCGLACCSCGQIFCVAGAGRVRCPGCWQEVEMVASDDESDFTVSRSRG